MATEIQSFEEDVLEKSRTVPVLVDFWAPWCGPCRILGPVLEKLASEQSGRWELVKINTDEHQDLSVQYGIRGIPAVKLFVDGKVVNEFTGALPEHALRAWLDDAIPSETGLRLQDASDRFFAGDHAAARSILKEVLAADPDNAQARVLFAATNVWNDAEQSATALEGVEVTDPNLIQIAEAVKEIAGVLAAELPDGPGRESFSAAVDSVKAGKFDAASEALIKSLNVDRNYDDDRARKLGVAMFTLLGREHPATKAHRRMFDMALY